MIDLDQCPHYGQMTVVEIDVVPGEPEYLGASHPGGEHDRVQGAQPIAGDVAEEGLDLVTAPGASLQPRACVLVGRWVAWSGSPDSAGADRARRHPGMPGGT